ncbi:MAG: HupE/UreJ family protein [Verrucomicrobia bacterium]|nr:HupE/UreJ family protein [Verrucomicrobiota bacterium]
MAIVRTRLFLILGVLGFVLVPLPVQAHVQGDMVGGFLPGLEHPISGLDHVLAMVTVGIWGAQLGRPAIWMLPIAFPMMMAVGAFTGLLGIGLPGIEIGIAFSCIALGGMVLTEAKPPLWVACLLVGFFALFHGHAHGTELPENASGLLYSIGFVISTGCLHACGIVIGLIHRWSAGRLVLRGAGACVLLGGAFFLWGAVA